MYRCTYILTPISRVQLEKLNGSQLRNSPHFMEPEGSLPHSHVPAACPYPEPARSSPYLQIPRPEDPLNIILPSTPGSSKWSLILRFPPQTLYAPLLSPIRGTCPTNLILLDFITPTILAEDYRSLRSSLCRFLQGLMFPPSLLTYLLHGASPS